MKNLLNPRWLLIINTLPVLLLTLLLSAQYSIIKSLLSEENMRLCIIFASSIFTLSASTLAYCLIQLFRKKTISLAYGFISLIAHVVFLYIYCNYLSEMIPLRTPLWILGDDIIIYVGTFLMPTMAHAVLIIVMWFTPDDKKHKPALNFGGALLIPVSWYLFAQVILPLWRKVDFDYDFHVVLVLAIASTILFLFLLIRTLYILTIQKSAFFANYPLAWKIPLAIVFPILGLLFNGGFLNEKEFWNSTHSIFGNFNSLWFYVLALLNGLLICLPNLSNRTYRLFLFCGRSILFAYTFYFFLVFLPYLPLSVLLILLAGAGFLMLTPLVLFVVHIQELAGDIAYLRTYVSVKVLYGISILGFTILPMIITAHDIHDKYVLKEALHYVYTPNYSESVRIDASSLQKTLNVLKHHKDRNSFFQRDSQTPYLSSLFKWIVLDNMTLSDYKIQTLEKIFLGKSETFNFQTNEFRTGNAVTLTNVKTKSVFDEKNKSWLSSIDLELTNTSTAGWQEEYATSFELPEGCWISDYYLYVGKKKEQGLLVEKKAALWIYSQIVNTRRDPGILYYLSGNKIGFRVFPFADKEVRQSGIEFIHQEPVDLVIDNQTIHLGEAQSEKVSSSEKVNDQVFYISSLEKESLPEVYRKPYYHFVVDVSQGKENSKRNYVEQIENLLAQDPLSGEHARISFTNSYTSTVPLNKNWKEELEQQSCEGGFYLEHAIKRILANAYLHPSNKYPVIVVMADSLGDAILDKDFGSLKFTVPESSHFYYLTDQGAMEPHALFDHPRNISTDTTHYASSDQNVLAWPDDKNTVAYLPNDHKPSIVIKGMVQPNNAVIPWTPKNYTAALYMQGETMSQVLHPFTSEEEWLDLLKQSFQTKVLTPYTSYIVVETESQKAMLLKKQRQTLSGNKSLDLQEDPQRMSEPGLMVVALLFGSYLLYKQRKKIRLRLR